MREKKPLVVLAVKQITESAAAAAIVRLIDALCVSDRSNVCVPPEANSDEPKELYCVRLEGWSRGFYGKDAGAVPAQ